MRRISLSVYAFLLLVLFIFSGCGKTNTDKTLISITSNGETTLPYLRFSWGSSMTDNGWLEADAVQLICDLPDIAPELPIVRYHDDFTVQYSEGVSYSSMLVYDDSFKPLDHIATYSEIDYLTCLQELPEGTYYIGIAVVEQGDYIESAGKYEHSGTDCVFKLMVEQ